MLGAGGSSTRLAITGVAVALLMLTSPFRPVNVAAQQSNTVLNVTLVVPPNSLNMVDAVSATSSYYITEIEYPVLGHAYLPNGSLTHERSIQTGISHNSNYTVWTFNINTTKRWSDGTTISPQDVLATMGPKYVMIPQYDIFGIGPETKQEYTTNSSAAVYVLNATDAHFDDKLSGQFASSVIYPASFVNNGGVNSSNFGTDTGGGPFYVSKYTQGAFQMVMLRNPYFTPAPRASEIDINFVESIAQTAEYLLAGTSDLAPVEPSNVASLSAKPSLGLYDGRGIGGITTLEYNSSIYPYNMTAFRQALAYGINQSQYVNQALAGYGIPGYTGEGLVSPAATAYYNPGIALYNYSPSRALSLLSSIGLNKGSDGYIRYPNGTTVSLTLWADTDNTADTVGAGVVQQNLKSLGFQVSLQTSTAANIASDYSGNVANIQSAMILFTNTFAAGAIPLYNVEPAWDTYWLPTNPHSHWEYPPSADAQYQSNFSAWTATDNPALDKQYTNNIEALNARNLPTIVVAYPDDLWAYNKASWTGWPIGGPNSFMDVATPQLISWKVLENLQPVSQATSTTSTTPTTTSVQAASDYVPIYAAVGVAAIAVVIVAALFIRRRPKG